MTPERLAEIREAMGRPDRHTTLPLTAGLREQGRDLLAEVDRLTAENKGARFTIWALVRKMGGTAEIPNAILITAPSNAILERYDLNSPGAVLFKAKLRGTP